MNSKSESREADLL